MVMTTAGSLQLTFKRRGCKPFLKRYGAQQAEIQRRIQAAVARELATGMTKVKVATPRKLAGLTCYEFRLNLGQLGSARLAFTVRKAQVTIYYISHDLQKATFSRELDRVIGQ